MTLSAAQKAATVAEQYCKSQVIELSLALFVHEVRPAKKDQVDPF